MYYGIFIFRKQRSGFNRKVYALLWIPLSGLIGGILFYQFVNLKLAILISILLSLFFIYHKKLPLLLCGFFIIGSAAGFFQQFNHGEILKSFGNKKITIQTTVKEVEKITNKRQLQIKAFITSASLPDSQILYPKKNVLLYISNHYEISPGDSITLTDIIIKRKKSKNERFPSFSDYLIKEGCIAFLFPSQKQISIKKSTDYSLSKTMGALRKNLYLSLRKKMPADLFSFFATLFLGNKQARKAQNKDHLFHFWGISHYLARSGLHIVIFIMLCTSLLLFVPCPLFIKQLILLFVCGVYYLFSWPSTSFMRALNVFLLYQTGQLLKLPVNFMHILNLVCLTTLIINPLQLFFLDFQLSYSLTFALALFLRENNEL